MTVTDLFTLEQLGPVVASPDGQWLAVVIARPRSSKETYRDFLWGPADADHADLWLLPRGGGDRRNITNGALDGSGYWSPVWSPDGKRLALLSTKGGDNIRPYLWERGSGTLRRLTDRGFDMIAAGDEGWLTAPLIWVDSTTLICPLRPVGAPPSYYSMTKIRSLSVALSEWAKATAGAVPTASVLSSGGIDPDTTRPRGQLVAFDVVSGRSRVVADGNFFSLLLSPSRRHLALIAETGLRPPAPTRKLLAYRSLTEEWWHTRLAIVSLAGRGKPLWITQVASPAVGAGAFLGDHPATWSPDGLSFALIGKDSTDDQAATTVFVVDAATGSTRSLKDRTLEVQSTSWSGDGELLIRARPRATRKEATDSTRWDWWAIDSRTMNNPRNITARLAAAPPMLIGGPDRHLMLAVVKGDLWTIDVRSGTTINLTGGRGPHIEAVVWPAKPHQRWTDGTLVVRTGDEALYRVDWDGRLLRTFPLRTPLTGAELADFRPEQDLAVFTGADWNGDFLWTGNTGTGRFERRVTLNQQLAQIADAQRMLIHYRGIEGDSLKGLVLLPVGYQPGKRYPLVSWVYPGLVVSDTVGHILSKHQVHSLNLSLIAAHGYAVLIPSMPLPAEGPPGDPYLDLPKGVMPAIDKLIDLGIADPQRLGVMGHSYGGYGTYALVSYTNRFKAAVAFAGPSDFSSIYGAAWNSTRYEEHASQEMFFPALAESGQFRMGGPPWSDVGRYLRNSPYYYLDRVHTPIMIIQGDMDYVPIQQAEQFFSGLYRLGRKAEFVRYWGEEHVITSPANTADMWNRVFTWLDERLKPDT